MASLRLAAFSKAIELWWTDASPNGVIVPNAIGAIAIEQLAGSTSLWQCTVLPSTWVNLSAGGGGVPLSSVTASLANASIDNTLFTEAWNWTTATTQTLFTLAANALTSGTILAVTSTAVGLTGHLALFQTNSAAAFGSGAVQILATGAYTGAALEVDSSTVTGDAVQINAGALTSGRALAVLSTALGLTGSLALFQSATTALLTNGAVRVNLTGAYTGAGFEVDTSTVTGEGMRLNANALTSGRGLAVVGTGTGLTGNLALFQSASTGALSAGAVRVNMTGAHTGAAIQVDTSTATGQALSIVSGALTTGTQIVGTANALTTGTMLDLSTTSAAYNSTKGLIVVANNSGTTTGILARFQSNSGAGSGLTLTAAGLLGLGTSSPGATFHNDGSTLYTTQPVADKAAGGALGAANATVDIVSSFAVNQTTVGQALTLPNPTTATAGRRCVVMNVGTQTFTMYGVVVTVAATPATAAIELVWNGTAWSVVQ